MIALRQLRRNSAVVSFSTSEGFRPVDIPTDNKHSVTPISSRHVPIRIAACR